MQQAPQQGVQPYPGPSYGPQPQYRPQSHGMGFLEIMVIVVIITAFSACGIIAYLFTNPFSDSYMGNGTQVFNGTVNETTMVKALKNASFVTDDGRSNPLFLKPFCGTLGSKEANESRALMQKTTASYNDSDVTVRYWTRGHTSSTYDAEHISDKLKCIMKKMKDIFVNELGMTVTKDKVSKTPTPTPGFEAVMVVSVVAVIVVIRGMRKRKQG